MNGWRQWRFRRGRLLAVTLAVVTLGGLVVVVGWSVHSARSVYQDQLEALRDQHERYARTLARGPALAQQLERLQQVEENKTAYLASQTPALAASYLQTAAKQRIAASGGRLTRLQVNPLQEAGRFARVSISVKARCDMESLARLLHALEAGQPVLFVERLVVRSLSGGRAVYAANQPSLDISFDLVGFMRWEGSSS